jgi:pre-mRNA-splicing helicase BRR2
MQSKSYPIAFGTDEPILLCAPTGAGKVGFFAHPLRLDVDSLIDNVAMLTILNELGKWRDESTGASNLNKYKIVCIAPMKALVQEMVGNFNSRLGLFRIKVGELTGDLQMTKQQIAETQIIVTTPEKWDVITRLYEPCSPTHH